MKYKTWRSEGGIPRLASNIVEVTGKRGDENLIICFDVTLHNVGRSPIVVEHLTLQPRGKMDNYAIAKERGDFPKPKERGDFPKPNGTETTIVEPGGTLTARVGLGVFKAVVDYYQVEPSELRFGVYAHGDHFEANLSRSDQKKLKELLPNIQAKPLSEV